MRKEKPPLGELELEVLRYVSEHPHITVRAAAEQFGEPRGLARTTILTVMERLRKKNYLRRHKKDGNWQYAPVIEQQEVMQGLVQDFVEKTLGGSLSPFVAYLAEAKNLSQEELSDLRKLVEELGEEGGPR